MRFKIERELLDQTLNSVSRGLSTKTPMPVLMGIYIKAENDKITFITTNREISVRVILPKNDNVSIEEAGDCVVPGKYFVDIVKKIDDGKLEFNVFEENTIKIISKSSEFTLAAYNKSSFPQINFDINSNPITFTCKNLKQIIKQTTFACATSEARIILTSVDFNFKDGILSATGTDAFRVSRHQEESSSAISPISINISAKSLEEFAKTIPDSNEEINLFVANNIALFKYNNMSFVTRLVEGNFPNIIPLFSQKEVLKIKFDLLELIQAVDRASLFTSTEKVNLVKFSVNKGSDNIKISSNSNEIGRVVIDLKALDLNFNEGFDEEIFNVAYSTKSLLEALRAFESKTVTFYFTGEIKHTILLSEEVEELSQVLMPIRTF